MFWTVYRLSHHNRKINLIEYLILSQHSAYIRHIMANISKLFIKYIVQWRIIWLNHVATFSVFGEHTYKFIPFGRTFQDFTILPGEWRRFATKYFNAESRFKSRANKLVIAIIYTKSSLCNTVKCSQEFSYFNIIFLNIHRKLSKSTKSKIFAILQCFLVPNRTCNNYLPSKWQILPY